MHAPALERSLETVLLADLHPHPANSRGSIEEADVEALISSIQARGILTPLMVRPSPLARPGFQILAGHRRRVAALAAGLTSVPCQVVTLDDEQAAAVVLLENLDREDPNLFRLADLVEKLLGLKGGSVQHVALLLGKLATWVARVQAIAGLEPSVRKAMDSEKCDWTVPMLLFFAGLAPEVQKQRWVEVRFARDITSLKQQMGEDFHVLKDAPFDIQSEALFPSAGSCAACPKTSARAPGLFDAGDLDPADPATLKKATCRDASCWGLKRTAALKLRIEGLAEQAGAKPLILNDEYLPATDPLRKVGKVLSSHSVQAVKKGDKGAVPAVTVDSHGRVGALKWVRPVGDARPHAEPKTKAPKPSKPVPPTEAQRLERFLQRRAAFIVDHVQKEVDGAKSAPYRLVRNLVAAFGVGTISREGHTESVKPGGINALCEKVGHNDEAWAARMWPLARMHAGLQLRRLTLDKVTDQWEDAITVYSLLKDLSLGEARDRLQRLAESEMPTPKVLEGALAEAQAHVNPPETGKAKGASRGVSPKRARRSTGKAAAAGERSED